MSASAGTAGWQRPAPVKVGTGASDVGGKTEGLCGWTSGLDVRCTSGPRACLKNGVVGRRSLCDWGQESAGLLVSGESSAASSAGQKKLLLESAQKLSSLKLRTWR